ncbi:MAG: penicillin-binding protein 2 [Myxococcales bacterium]|nr:penicillin-binding protein 2 [Myxococcales bacterium]
MQFNKPHRAGVRLDGRTDLREYDSRLRFVLVIFLIPLLILVARLWYLQILHGNEYLEASIRNTVDQAPLVAPRGTIYDARGRVLAENRPSFDVYIVPGRFMRSGGDLNLLRAHLSLSDNELEDLQGLMADEVEQAIRIRRDVNWNQLAALETDHLELPGIRIEENSHRHYPYDDLLVHVLGFMGEVPDSRLADLEPLGYEEGDYVGRAGLEQALEPVLRGEDGLEQYVVDARGHEQGDEIADWILGDYRYVSLIPGRNVFLTMDVELQRIMREAIQGYDTGAAVAIDPRDGSILAMYSHPGYDPNAWTGRLSQEEFQRDVNDPMTRLFDRAIHAYFPGSTFKIVTAVAALEEGLIGPNDTLHCDGSYTYGGNVFRCNRHNGHGDITLAEALQQSCNVYFFKLGERLGIDRLVEYGQMFGFGESPESGLPNESAGRVPTREWLEEHSPEGFQYGQVLNVSVGQGDTRTSPLQMAMAYAALANHGTLFYPRLIDRIESAEGGVLFQYPSRIHRTLPIHQESIERIVQGLNMAVNVNGGTAYNSRLEYVRIAGKTGTAEGTQIDTTQVDDSGQLPREARTSAWFAGFAPVEDPQIVVVVFLEHGGSGGANAAPVGSEIIDRYFREVLDYDVEIRSAVASGESDQLDGLMRLNRPGSEEDVRFQTTGYDNFMLGSAPGQSETLLRSWRENR